jgi:hypothetical protein
VIKFAPLPPPPPPQEARATAAVRPCPASDCPIPLRSPPNLSRPSCLLHLPHRSSISQSLSPVRPGFPPTTLIPLLQPQPPSKSANLHGPTNSLNRSANRHHPMSTAAHSPAGPATPSTSTTSLSSSAAASNHTFVMPSVASPPLLGPPLGSASSSVGGAAQPRGRASHAATPVGTSPRRGGPPTPMPAGHVGPPFRADIITTVGARPACLVNASVNYVEDPSAVYAFGGFDQYSDEIYNVSFACVFSSAGGRSGAA